ncbi:SDR family oxidoreductase [Aquibium carbonis]|uniref:SDR family oxidoreductase n=1 Tax=Aquibium carbonis TaxID=2495581 RepID=A0A3S0A6I7_9HYPH|nr:SDR family oxidoreductase [Aquibium carbonis]RST85885.1 SDR family oxidoreductase [Aquibium carbonis]
MHGQKRVALVTGGARRIGAAIAVDLAAHGFAVAVHCNRSTLEADALVGRIAAAGGTAGVFQADLANADGVSSLVAKVRERFGAMCLLVNNASVFEPDSARSPDWALWDTHFTLHLKAPVQLASEMVRDLPAGETGLIVNIIDQRVWRLTPQFFSYTLSKSALWTATRTMAQEFAPTVRVNAIGPGPTLANERQQPDDLAAQQEGLPLRKGPLLTEFGSTIRYLWDTPSITGQMIALDGGQHLAWQTPDVTGMRE